MLNEKILSLYRTNLIGIIKEKSYKTGLFTLTSGKTSDFYFDGKQTTLHPMGGFLTASLMLAEIHKVDNIAAVGGLELGACPIVSAISIVSNGYNPLPAFYIRKNPKGHGTKNYIEGLNNLTPACNVCLVEDTVTTGGSFLKAIERVTEQGFNVKMIITLVDRNEGGSELLKEHGYNLISIFNKSDFK